jgi:hypothetical protein
MFLIPCNITEEGNSVFMLRKYSGNVGEIGRIQSRKRGDFTRNVPAFSVIPKGNWNGWDKLYKKKNRHHFLGRFQTYAPRIPYIPKLSGGKACGWFP